MHEKKAVATTKKMMKRAEEVSTILLASKVIMELAMSSMGVQI
jgi:hypothetical protein